MNRLFLDWLDFVLVQVGTQKPHAAVDVKADPTRGDHCQGILQIFFNYFYVHMKGLNSILDVDLRKKKKLNVRHSVLEPVKSRPAPATGSG